MSLLGNYSTKIKKRHNEILVFIHNNGPQSLYDMKMGVFNKGRGTKENLSKSYSSLHKSVKELEDMKFVQSTQITSGGRLKKIISLTDTGSILLILLLSSKLISPRTIKSKPIKLDEEMMLNSFKEIFEKNKPLNIINKNLENFLQVVTKKTLNDIILHAATKLIDGKYVHFKIDDPKLDFKAYYYQFIENLHRKDNEVTFAGKQKDNRLVDFLKLNTELKNSYIAFLAIHDLWALANGQKSDEAPTTLLSETEITFLENLDQTKNNLFGTKRVKSIFPIYTTASHMFLGYLIFQLMWMPIETKPKIIENKYHVDWTGISVR